MLPPCLTTDAISSREERTSSALVTERPAHLFDSPIARRLLGEAMRQCLVRYPVQVIAIVLLPDHLHTLWTLPHRDHAYWLRWRWIKREFTRRRLALVITTSIGGPD